MARPRLLTDGTVTLKTRVPQADDTALNSLASATGEAKASHLRRALSQYLETFDLANPKTTSVVTHPKEIAR